MLVIVPFDVKKWLSGTFKKFQTLDKKSLESLYLTPAQILPYGALDPIKDSVSKPLASEIGKSLRTGRRTIGRMSCVLLS